MLHPRVALLLFLGMALTGAIGTAGAARAEPSFAAVSDATGAILGPVAGYSPSSAVFTVSLGGKTALLAADRTTLTGVGDASVWFASADCSGQAYVQWTPANISPPSSIGGPTNTVYVGDPAAVQANIVANSRYFGAGSACQPYPPTSEYFVPVDPVGTLPAVAPFTLVPFAAGTAPSVPAVGGWGLLALGLALAVAAFLRLRAPRVPRGQRAGPA